MTDGAIYILLARSGPLVIFKYWLQGVKLLRFYHWVPLLNVVAALGGFGLEFVVIVGCGPLFL